MAANINGCHIDVVRRYHVYRTIRNVFVGDMLVCEQESQIMAMVLI